MNLKRFAVPLVLLGFSMALTPILVNAQVGNVTNAGNMTQGGNATKIDKTTFFKAGNMIVLRLNNPYNATQWGNVATLTTEGFRIMDLIPGSDLKPDTDNPALLFVVMQKFK